MNKSLKDWTLEETQKYVKNIKNCCKCVFYNGTEVCPFIECPKEWMLSKKHRSEPCNKRNFTEQEIQFAKALMQLFSKTTCVCRHSRRLCVVDLGIQEELNPSEFPSIKDGESVKLAEIVGCEE